MTTPFDEENEKTNAERNEESDTPFTDRLFRFDRRLTTVVLRNNPEEIFAKLTVLDLGVKDACRLIQAADIRDHDGQWCIGVFNEEIVIARKLYPKDTVAVLQGRKPGKRCVLFSFDPDETLPLEAFED